MTHPIEKAAALAALLVLAGCGAFPKIIFLHDPLSPQEHLQLGAAYEASNDPAAAEKEYRAALEQNPDPVPALIALGNLQVRQGDFRQAEKLYRRALKRSPDHPMANNNLAWLLIERGGDLHEAEARIDRAIAADPGHRAFYLDTRANLYLRLGLAARAGAAAAEAESAPGSGDPALAGQLRETRSKIENSLRSGDPSGSAGAP